MEAYSHARVAPYIHMLPRHRRRCFICILYACLSTARSSQCGESLVIVDEKSATKSRMPDTMETRGYLPENT